MSFDLQRDTLPSNVEVKGDSQQIVIVSFGEKSFNSECIVSVSGGSSAEVLGILFLTGEAIGHLKLGMTHKTQGTNGNVLIHAVVSDSATLNFEGMIKIEKSAQQTVSYLANKNLLLSENARAITIPGLEIEADDVRASHGATISNLSAQDLFYMQSRGLTGSDARLMMVKGFLTKVIDKIEDQTIKAHITNDLAKFMETKEGIINV